MKHWIGSFALVCLSGMAFSQTSFTIVRPLDHAKVREKVRVTFPKGSIPENGYIGVFLGGKFIEAVRPPLVPIYRTVRNSVTKQSSQKVVGSQFEYLLDTKGRGIADTELGKPLKLEALLFVDYNEQPRIVDRSSVEINIANQSSIAIPADGLKLRYNFKAGKETIYDLERKVVIEPISAEQNQLGGKAAQLDVESEKIRLLYAIDNTYPGGDGLVRIQPLPERGKKYAVMTAENASGPMVFQESDMAPIYMKVTPTGEEVFGAVPAYFGLDGSGASQGSTVSLYAPHPLPTLPVKSIRPGDSWQSRFQLGTLDLSRIYQVSSVVRKFPARGEFIGVEWEMGRRCAKIRNSIAAGSTSIEGRKLAKLGANFTDEKVAVEETIWFDIDDKKVVKILQDMTIETRGDASAFGFGNSAPSGAGAGAGAGAGGFPGGPPGGFPGGGRGGYPGGRGGGFPGGAGPGKGGGEGDVTSPLPANQFPGAYGGGQGARGARGARGGRGFGSAGRSGGAAAPTQAAFIRIRVQSTFTLEK